MATWIVHLRIAEMLLDRISGLEPAYFSIGNIAPDSGVPDEKWEHFNPPPEILHFKNPGQGVWEMADFDFYRRYVYPQKVKAVDPQRLSFLYGYFFHLVIDNLWREEIGLPTQKRFATEFEKERGFIWTVKRDWYGLDFEYVRNYPGSIFWQEFMGSEYEGDYLDFLPKDCIQQRMSYIKEFYQRRDEEIEEWYIRRPGLYLTKAEWDEFIERNIARLEKIYGWLQEPGVEGMEVFSVLSLEVGKEKS